jgi:glutaminase
MDIQLALEQVYAWQQLAVDRGVPYTGIAAQATRSAALFTCGWAGVVDGQVVLYSVGDTDSKWSLQSVVKTEVLARVLTLFGVKGVNEKLVLFRGAGHFASSAELAELDGMPKNAFVNPGAMRLVAALIQRLGTPQNVYAYVVGGLNARLRPDTPRFSIRHEEAEPVYLEEGLGSGNLAIAETLANYDRLFGLEPAVVVETYHTVCATTGTIGAILETFFHYGDGHDVFGRPVLPDEESWQLLMSAIVALGSYSDAVLDMAKRRAGKTGGSGLLVNPTFGTSTMPPGIFVAASPGLGGDLNPLLPMLAAEEFGRIMRCGLWDARYGRRKVT